MGLLSPGCALSRRLCVFFVEMGPPERLWLSAFLSLPWSLFSVSPLLLSETSCSLAPPASWSGATDAQPRVCPGSRMVLASVLLHLASLGPAEPAMPLSRARAEKSIYDESPSGAGC